MTQSNRKLIAILGAVTIGMFGFGFAMVPLYDIFCEITGLRLSDGGTGRREVVQQPIDQTQAPRWVTVTFDSDVDRGLPWHFSPHSESMRVQVGVLTETSYLARNESNRDIVGHAVPSVAPAEASLYFAKTECFCFTEQQLAAGESRDMGVRFMVDRDLPEDIKVLTLSYRFYTNKEATKRLTQNAAYGDPE